MPLTLNPKQAKIASGGAKCEIALIQHLDDQPLPCKAVGNRHTDKAPTDYYEITFLHRVCSFMIRFEVMYGRPKCWSRLLFIDAMAL
ncbi:hypothetical protein D3C75_764520 [compost metagenome]